MNLSKILNVNTIAKDVAKISAVRIVSSRIFYWTTAFILTNVITCNQVSLNIVMTDRDFFSARPFQKIAHENHESRRSVHYLLRVRKKKGKKRKKIKVKVLGDHVSRISYHWLSRIEICYYWSSAYLPKQKVFYKTGFGEIIFSYCLSACGPNFFVFGGQIFALHFYTDVIN